MADGIDLTDVKGLAGELETRAKARGSFLEFVRELGIEPEPALHHKALIRQLQRVADGDLKRLFVFMPPGCAKSTYCSVQFPAYYLGKHRKKRVIAGSYDTSLPTQFGGKIRNIVSSPEYQRIFPVPLSRDTRAKSEWDLVEGGGFYAVGVDSGVTGRRCHLGILDDVMKGRKAADSSTVRHSTWEWYKSDFRTRLYPDAAIVYICTRWHEDDPAGRILGPDWSGESGPVEGTDGEIWEVLCLPAEAKENDPIGREPGEWLWPEWFTPSFWEQEKITQGPRNWNALYQQNPTPDQGTFFNRENFWRYEVKDLPPVRKYMTGDFAVTDEKDAVDPDYTEIGVHGVAQAYQDGITVSKLYLCLDGWSGRRAPQDWVHEYFNLVKAHEPDCEFAEVGVIRRAIEGLLSSQRRARSAYGVMKWMPHIGDKVANARALQALSEMGLVGIANNEYGDYCLEQLIKFPAGKHDDAVDMMALIGRAIREAHPMLMTPTKESEEQQDRYDRAFARADTPDYDWKVH